MHMVYFSGSVVFFRMFVKPEDMYYQHQTKTLLRTGFPLFYISL